MKKSQNLEKKINFLRESKDASGTPMASVKKSIDEIPKEKSSIEIAKSIIAAKGIWKYKE